MITHTLEIYDNTVYDEHLTLLLSILSFWNIFDMSDDDRDTYLDDKNWLLMINTWSSSSVSFRFVPYFETLIPPTVVMVWKCDTNI